MLRLRLVSVDPGELKHCPCGTVLDTGDSGFTVPGESDIYCCPECMERFGNYSISGDALIDDPNLSIVTDAVAVSGFEVEDDDEVDFIIRRYETELQMVEAVAAVPKKAA